MVLAWKSNSNGIVAQSPGPPGWNRLVCNSCPLLSEVHIGMGWVWAWTQEPDGPKSEKIGSPESAVSKGQLLCKLAQKVELWTIGPLVVLRNVSLKKLGCVQEASSDVLSPKTRLKGSFWLKSSTVGLLGPGPWALGLGPWAKGVWQLSPWALDPRRFLWSSLFKVLG